MDILDMDTPIFNDVKDDTPIYDQMIAEYEARERASQAFDEDDTAEIMILPHGVELIQDPMLVRYMLRLNESDNIPYVGPEHALEVFDNIQLLIDNVEAPARHARPQPTFWRRLFRKA